MIEGDDLYLVICSDGVWEFLQNNEVYEKTLSFFYNDDPEGLCKKLIELSTELWTREDDAIDDITAIAVFLDT